MKNISYKKNEVSKISVKGILSNDATEITYIDDDKNEQTIEVKKCMKMMAGNEIVLTIALKNDTDLTEELDGDLDE